MTASATLSVLGAIAVPAAPMASEGAVMSDAGAFGALLRQQRLPQLQGNPQGPIPDQPLPAETLLVDGGEGGVAFPAGAPFPEFDLAQIQDAASVSVRPVPAVGITDGLVTDAVLPPAGGEVMPVVDAAVQADAATPEPSLLEAPNVELDDSDVPPADDTVTDVADGSTIPPALVQQQPPAQPANLAGAAAPSLVAPPAGKIARNEAVAGADPDAVHGRSHDRSPVRSVKARETAKGEGASSTVSASPPTSAAGNAATADAGALIEGGDNGLSSPLLTQTLPAVTARPAGSPYPAAGHGAAHEPVVKVEPGAIGRNVGMEMAKVAKAGRDDLLIRLDPRDMGRVDVRLSFDSDGVLRAVLSADSPAALDMLRRESGDLNRALADAGVRSDAQSLRFDARPGGQGAGSGSGEGWHREQPHGALQSRGLADECALDHSDPIYRSLSASGHVDLMA